MYCHVIFGESKDRHTRKYLYKCTKEIEPGEIVLAPIKNTLKAALVSSTFGMLPERDSIDSGKIGSVISKSDKIVGADVVKSFLLALIDEYKDGNITKEDLYLIMEHIVSFCEIKLDADSVLAEIINVQLPDACLHFVDEPWEEERKELGFWKELKDIEYKLRYGYSFWDRPKNRSGYIKEDPIEYTDEYLQVELELERVIRNEIGEGGYRGFCHKYWLTKKKILQDRFGIRWKSPVDLNPQIWFD